MRKVMHLNYDWKYSPDFKEEYIQAEFNDYSFKDIMIPHTNIETPFNNFDETISQFVSCYRKSIFIDEKVKGKRAILHFDGVMTYAKVYINGKYVFEHKGGYTPFKCDITNFIKYNENNSLVVMVDSTERKDIPPFGYVIDYLTYGGIYREVRLEFVNSIHTDNVYVKTKNVLSEKKRMDIVLYFANNTGKSEKLQLIFKLKLKEKEICAFSQEVNITQEESTKLNTVYDVPNVLLWDTINPNLYNLNVMVKKGDDILDEYTVRFGFREAVFRNDGFYLNGEKLKLRGLNRHQSFPYVGYAMPKSAQYKDAEILKNDLGVNIVRLSHYPQSKHFLDRCDELGLLVFDEIPGWQHIGDKEWQQVAIKNVEEMIKKDWNRPSIILWGVRINESQDNDEFYIETNKTAKAWDDVRQTGGVRNFEESHFFEDVYTYNDFVHRGNNIPLQNPRSVIKKDVPYLVTEHNGHMFPTKKYDNEVKRTEHAVRHLRVLSSMYSNPSISGSIGWCMFDYNTHKDFGSGDRICYHGVLDMFRIPKDAAAVYGSQQDSKPVLNVLSSMDKGEIDAAEIEKVYIFTNCDYVKVYKNKECLGTYYPAKEEYSAIPHPPIIIKDFIGDLLEKKEGFSKKDSDRIKEILYAIVKYGDKSLPLKYKLKMLRQMFKHKMPYEKAVGLYTTYVANWGCESLYFDYVGYKNNEPVLTVKKGTSTISRLTVIPDKNKLIEDETYDVCRVVIKHIDQNENVMTYSTEVVGLDIKGAGEIIGPKHIPLIGGSSAFWVKTIGTSGNITIKITSQRFGEESFELQAEKF